MPRPPRSDDGLFTCCELQQAWGLSSEQAATRARRLTLIRFNVLVLIDPERALRESAELMGEAREALAANRARFAATLRDEPLTEPELDLLQRIQTGKVDTSELNQAM